MYKLFLISLFLNYSFWSFSYEKELIDISNSNTLNNIVIHSGEVEIIFDEGMHRIKVSATKNNSTRFSIFLPNEHKNLNV